MNIHVIEPLNNFVKLTDDKWESGGWSIDENKAQRLIGGAIYFHKKRFEPSFFGGSIIEYRLDQDSQNQGRIFFTFQYDVNCRNVNTDKRGWSKRIKIIANE